MFNRGRIQWVFRFQFLTSALIDQALRRKSGQLGAPKSGIRVKKLEIHGRVGMVIHAILEKYDCDLSSQNHEFKVFDFCTKSIHCVKEFLVQYYKDYDAGNCQMNQQEKSMQPEADRNIKQSAKIPLAMQRVRTGLMKLKDVIGYFDHPIEDAARKLNVCPTVMKKICRRDGLPRWPYRKVKSIKKKILEKNEILTCARGDEEREQAEADIHKFQQELAKIYGIHS
ncbi:unnamed protein product [Fraxinus pennsylvanica]|uniref:RWP-RK domain-containing protein n=1 Tax=Fraxinus pennsylvanica TaxID=56036 RepID=A0AAD1ZA80_9LAMI|nr:unnamed protein product [Fraxinus pennsylvanica]